MSNPTHSPHFFELEESEYSSLVAGQATLTFPAPFTLTHYFEYVRALVETKEDKKRELTDDDRLYRAAVAVSTLDVTGEIDPSPDSENLSMAFQTWVIECAEKYIGPMLRLESVDSQRTRRIAENKRGNVFEIDEAAVALVPALRGYEGTLAFHPYYTAGMHKAYRKALEKKPNKVVANDVENTLGVRAFRAAMQVLVSTMDIGNGHEWIAEEAVIGLSVPNKTLHGNDIPMPLVSWVIECADTYLWHRTRQKK